MVAVPKSLVLGSALLVMLLTALTATIGLGALGWGVGLFFHGWDTFAGDPKEARIRREMERLERE